MIGLQAMRAWGALSGADSGTAVALLATSDEEIGSPTSRALIEAEAATADAVLVLEPALEHGGASDGGRQDWRKGVGEFRLEVTGVPAHAGWSRRRAPSAVQELARQLIAIQDLALTWDSRDDAQRRRHRRRDARQRGRRARLGGHRRPGDGDGGGDRGSSRR